ncbi:hypothetical protein HDU76_002663, partial [Blyttiomyces sp. JEL0837]
MGGTTRTVMIANVNPLISSYTVTANTLSYASAARQIENTLAKYEEFEEGDSSDDEFVE